MDEFPIVGVPATPHDGVKALVEAIARYSGVMVKSVEVSWEKVAPMGEKPFFIVSAIKIESEKVTP